MILVLWDIDGTLLRTAGAGREALDHAFRVVHGWEDATQGVHVAGSTDRAILRDVGARFGGAMVDHDAVRDQYLAALEVRLADPARVQRCPGVTEALDAVEARAHSALLTGNWEAGARLKLGACALWERFAWGAFADDAEDRDALVPIARARARARGLDVREVVVVGDTPADVGCARAGGAVAVAVETGFATPEALAASRPDLQLPDLRRGLPALLDLLARC